MPGVTRTNNSVLTALVSGDPQKAKALAERYGIEHIFTYDQYDEFLASNVADAIYLALPNWMHHDYAVKALEAGWHVLLEKPMATSLADCIAIEAATARYGAKLMMAYRLHFEAATLEAVRLAQSGAIGALRSFSSIMSQNVAPTNHRAQNGFWAGPIGDMASYPLNAARNLFRAEPLTVHALGARSQDAGFDFDETVNVSLLFPGGCTGHFTVTYAGEPFSQYTLVGDEGVLEVRPGYGFGLDRALTLSVTQAGQTKRTEYPASDQFAAEAQYFAQCLLDGQEPEPDGEEGRADIRIMAAIEQSLATGMPISLPPATRRRWIDVNQGIYIPASPPPPTLSAGPARIRKTKVLNQKLASL
jgi:predicted dehydrogenase